MVLVLMVLLSVVWLVVTSGPFGVPSLKPARARHYDNASRRAAGPSQP
jgi:hypothetical protein